MIAFIEKSVSAYWLKTLIQRYEKEFSLPENLVASVIYKESKGNPIARRYENAFYDKYLAGKTKLQLGGHFPKIHSHDTELRDRAYSYGLMQIMGQTARELGFVSDNFMDLLSPEQNIRLGANKLARCIKAEKNLILGLARYNGSPGNPATLRYAEDVLTIKSSGMFQEIYK